MIRWFANAYAVGERDGGVGFGLYRFSLLSPESRLKDEAALKKTVIIHLKTMIMADQSGLAGGTRAGTIGGTLVVLLFRLHGEEVWKTVVLAAVGAAVSFGVSKALQWLVKRLHL